MGTPPPIQLANLGMADTLILMVLALVVFGPRRLPQIGRQIGKLMYEFRKASNDFKFQMEEELRNAEEADRRKKEEEERQRALAAAPPPPQLEAITSPAAETAAATPELARFGGCGKSVSQTSSLSAILPPKQPARRNQSAHLKSLASRSNPCAPACHDTRHAFSRPLPARRSLPSAPARSRSSRNSSAGEASNADSNQRNP